MRPRASVQYMRCVSVVIIHDTQNKSLILFGMLCIVYSNVELENLGS